MDSRTQAKIQELGDLELAVLICMIAREHCMLSTDGYNNDLRDELCNICRHVFGLHPAVVECSSKTTADEFSESILVQSPDQGPDGYQRQASYGFPPAQVGPAAPAKSLQAKFGSNTLDTRRIADLIIAVDLDLASDHVQVQALELIRTKRMFTRTAMHTAHKEFTVLAITSKPGARLSHHLNDLFCMSHFHSAEDGFAYTNTPWPAAQPPIFSETDIEDLRTLASSTRLTPELAAYLHNIVVFMRNSRYVAGGVTATATRQLRAIAKVLAPLHGLDYVPPSLVALAAHKIYPHRLKRATAKTERSLQWGSDPEAVRQLLEGVSVEWVIDDVLGSVETPL